MNQILDFGNDDNKENNKKNKEINKIKVNSDSNVIDDRKNTNGNNINYDNVNNNNNNNNNNDNIIISPKIEHPTNEFENENENLNSNSSYNIGNENIGYNNHGSFNNNNMDSESNFNNESSINSEFNNNYNSDMNRANKMDDSYDTMEQFIPNIQNKNKGNTVGKKAIAIILIIAAVVIAGIAIITLRKNAEKSKNLAALKEKIQITIMEEENSTVALNISSINPVDKIVYSWNGKTDQEKQIDGKGRREISERGIEMPIGSNMIKVNVIDNQGNTQTAEKTFESKTGKDINKPEITITNKGAIIEVVVKDDVGLKEATSQMGNDKKAIYPAKKDEPGEIKFQVTAKEGTETLQVVAVDLAGNVTKEEREIKGVARPEVKVEQTSDTTKLIIKVKHNVGIAKVEYALNGQGYIKTYEQNDPNNKDVELTQELAVGENTIKVKATSVEGFESNIFSSKAIRTPGANATPFAIPSNTNMVNTNQTMQNPNYGVANMQYPNMTNQPAQPQVAQPNMQNN